MSANRITSFLLAAAFVGASAFLGASESHAQPQGKESDCGDRIDNDKDGLADCFDADCFDDAKCKSSGGTEATNMQCSDGVDNDGDGYTDCDDVDCYGPIVNVCGGSWRGSLSGGGIAPSSSGSGASNANSNPDAIPELGDGMTVLDLLGTGSDVDGERNDFVCSDGFDNDNDGKVDCEDWGCRFDPEVTVCAPQVSGLRFSVWAHIAQTYRLDPINDEQRWDTQFNRIQLRSFGEIPFVQDSFFLLSIRAERTPRLTFATFSFPLGGGHFINFNSGGGGLSNGLVLGTQKNILLDRAFYLYSAFEAGNGAAVEFNGPIVPGTLEYRAFAAGGSGNFNGNIGGRFFRGDDFNYTYGVGGQLAWFPIGRFDRWDSRFLYQPAPTGLSFYWGGRYDQRVDERFGATNLSMLFRTGYFLTTVEGWAKREFEFESWQFSYNATVGVLLVPRWLMIAADIGQFIATDFENLPEGIDQSDLTQSVRRQTNQLQWRAALHFFAWERNGVLSFLYSDNLTEDFNSIEGNDRRDREARLELRMGF